MKLAWVPDVPDKRDLKYCTIGKNVVKIPNSIDLRKFGSEIEDQSSLGSCHDEKTKVLTIDGWKYFKDIDENDMLATVNPKDNTLIFENPKSIIRYKYEGDMYYFKHRSLNIAVTPDHNMLVRKWIQKNKKLSNNYSLVEAKNIGWYTGLMTKVKYKGTLNPKYYEFQPVEYIGGTPATIKNKIKMKVWLKFLGIFLADGTMLKLENDHYGVQIAAKKDRKKVFLRKLFNRMGIKFGEFSDRFKFCNKEIWKELEYLGLYRVHAPQKFVPKFIFSLPSKKIKIFLKAFESGDGYVGKNGTFLYTSSKLLSEDMQTLLFLCGTWSSISIGEIGESTTSDGRIIKANYKPRVVVEWKQSNLSISRKKDLRIKNYSGIVYCAEMPTFHTLVTKRFNKLLISGNCTANSVVSSMEFLENKNSVRNFEDFSRLFVYYNTRSLEGTLNWDSGASLRNTIKALAKWGACNEIAWPYNINSYTVKPTNNCYNDAKPHKITSYYRLNTLNDMFNCLASGYPFVFGFSVYNSFYEAGETAIVPMPRPGERLLGGHAVCAFGYNIKLKRFIVRNSWGSDWGASGYFNMPFAYMEDRDLSDDFWTIRR